jgi:MFS family permease
VENREGRRNARIYLIGLGASSLGDSAMSLVAGIWVKSLTGSSAAAAIVSACLYVPSLFGPVAGMVADRVRRRPLLVLVNLASAAIMLPLLLVRSPGQVWLIYVVTIGYGSSLALIDAAESALFAVMLPVGIRRQVNGLRLALQEGGKLVAPLLGAGLFVLLGGGVVAAVDAGTFLIAALALLRLRVHEARPRPAGRHWLAELSGGFGYLRRVAVLRTTVIAGALAMVISGVGVAAQYSLVDALHRPPSFLGLLTGALGAGSIIASLTSGTLIKRIGERRLVLLGLVNGVLGNLIRIISTTPAALAGSFVLGFALPWTVVAVVNLAQRGTPAALQGRVAAAITLALFAPQPLAHASGALAIAHVDYRTIYVGMAIATLASAIWFQRASRVQLVDAGRGAA